MKGFLGSILIFLAAIQGSSQTLFDQSCCRLNTESGCGSIDQTVFFECSEADDFELAEDATITAIEIAGSYQGGLNDLTHQGVTLRIWTDEGSSPSTTVWEQTYVGITSSDGSGSFLFELNQSLKAGIYWVQVVADATGSGGSWNPHLSRPEDNWRGTRATTNVETFGSWFSAEQAPGLLFRIEGEASPPNIARRMVPHVTQSGGNFTTEVILANLTDTIQNYDLTAYDSSGNQIGTAQGSVDPNLTLYQPAETLFGSQNVSHFSISEETGVAVTVAYQANIQGSGPAHVQETSLQAPIWRFYPGNRQVTWDGLAVVNTGNAPTDITVRQIGSGGALLANATPIANLAPNAKGLYVIGGGFQPVADAHYEISATQPLALTTLRGTQTSDFFWENVSAPVVPGDRSVAHITQAGGNFTTQVIIANETGTVQGYDLTAVDPKGDQIATANGEIEANSTQYTNVEALFGTPNIAHLIIANSSEVRVSIAYQANKDNTGPAHVQESSRQAKAWRIYPGNNQVTWDGFAVVNKGLEPTAVTITQINQFGQTVASRDLGSELQPNIKGLYVISNQFEAVPGSHFVVSGTQPLALTPLRGNWTSDFLWENRAIPID